MADFKKAFGVVEKREAVRARKWRNADRVEYALRKLFEKNMLSRTERQVRIENYPVSPYASVESKTVNVYFYAPVELAGRTVEFFFNGKETLRDSYAMSKSNSSSYATPRLEGILLVGLTLRKNSKIIA